MYKCDPNGKYSSSNTSWARVKRGRTCFNFCYSWNGKQNSVRDKKMLLREPHEAYRPQCNPSGGYPIPGWGVNKPRSQFGGCPSLNRMRYPWNRQGYPSWGSVTPWPGLGYPPRKDLGSRDQGKNLGLGYLCPLWWWRNWKHYLPHPSDVCGNYPRNIFNLYAMFRNPQNF